MSPERAYIFDNTLTELAMRALSTALAAPVNGLTRVGTSFAHIAEQCGGFVQIDNTFLWGTQHVLMGNTTRSYEEHNTFL